MIKHLVKRTWTVTGRNQWTIWPTLCGMRTFGWNHVYTDTLDVVTYTYLNNKFYGDICMACSLLALEYG